MTHSLWKLQILVLNDKTIASGIVIRGKARIQSNEDNRYSSLFKIIRSYFYRPYKEAPITLAYNGLKKTVYTGKNGEFRMEIPERVLNDIEFYIPTQDESLIAVQDYPVRFNNLENEYLVVSDIDDTILQSFTKNKIRKLRQLLFRSPAKRKMIESTHQAFQSLSSDNVTFLYLSRSEYNLFHLILTFIKENNFPVGPILLRKMTRWKRLINQKGKGEFKYTQLDEIFRQGKIKKLIFFGDDSQYDLEIYQHFQEKFPEQVMATFIHRVKKRISQKEKEWERLEKESEVHFYSHFSEIEEHINSIKNEITIRS